MVHMSGGNPQELIVFGPSHVEMVPYLAINELPQVRQKYDPEALADLALSMETTPDQEIEETTKITGNNFDLMTPLSIGRHTLKSAKVFLREHADFHEIPSEKRRHVDELARLSDGRIAILNAGHRRKRAVAILAKKYGLNIGAVVINSDVRDDIPFARALGLQLRENNHDRPPAYDEARAISLCYKDTLRHTGSAPSVQRVARELGFSETKVRDALAFGSLPSTIQGLARDGTLPYGTIRRLKPLNDLYERLYAGPDHATVVKSVEDELLAFCNRLLNNKLSGKADQNHQLMIEGKMRELQNQAEYQEGLFLVEPEIAARRRQESTASLSKLALSVIRYQIRTGALPLDAMGSLVDMLQEARLVQESRRVVLDTFEETED